MTLNPWRRARKAERALAECEARTSVFVPDGRRVPVKPHPDGIIARHITEPPQYIDFNRFEPYVTVRWRLLSYQSDGDVVWAEVAPEIIGVAHAFESDPGIGRRSVRVAVNSDMVITTVHDEGKT